MKRWALITVGLYLVTLLLLTVPVGWACLGWGPKASSLSGIASFFSCWQYWVWIGVAVVSQILLLVVPVALGERRPRSRRHLLVPVLTAAFLFAVMCLVGFLAVIAGIWGDHGLTKPLLIISLICFGIMWIIWAVMFYRFSATSDPTALTHRLMRWLLRGSILELLIAVPCHVATRNRNDCCAPVVSFWGIAAGLTVMLLSFGPGVWFLFVARAERKRVAAAGPARTGT